MSKFKDTYKTILMKNEDSAIAENPILALVNGTPDGRVRDALRLASWTENDIEELINSTKVKIEASK
jgi:hypothetical protein